MRARLLITMALAAVVTAFGSIRAAEGDTPPRRPGAGGNNQANLLLQHADELGLTAEQKTKLQEFAKGPMSVLTDEQKTKARELLPQRRAGAGGANRPNANAPKPEEKKTEDKKPDEKKPEEKNREAK